MIAPMLLLRVAIFIVVVSNAATGYYKSVSLPHRWGSPTFTGSPHVLAGHLLSATTSDEETRELFFDASARCGRGQEVNSYREEALKLLDQLEDSYEGKVCTPEQLCGTWELCFATDDITRSSPFFWAFRKALVGKKDSTPVRQLASNTNGNLADSILFVTDSIPEPLKSIGRAEQEIRFDVDSIASIDKQVGRVAADYSNGV